MTPFENFIQILTTIIVNFKVWWLMKLFFIVGLGLYLAFAFIIIRQVGLMSKTLNGEFAQSIKIISWFHFLLAVGVFFLALIVL